MDNGQFTEEQRAEAFRLLHARHLERQTSAVESIRTYVAIWFWLTIAGGLLIFVLSSMASRSSF